MKTTVGIFASRADAERAIEQLRSIGIADDHISLLMPGASEKKLEAVATTETEQPGMGKTLGGVVGGALGASSGMSLGAAAASLLVPGVGPVIATGIIGAALLGAGGAAAGAAAGEALEEGMADGLPRDELFIYEDALRRGRSVVIAFTEDDDQYEEARAVMNQAGAESVDAAREDWWLGLRDVEEEFYREQGGDFKKDELKYRRGFESALHPEARGKDYDEAAEFISACYGDICNEEPFRRGYQRGRQYHRALREKYKG
ncbi:MAG TPA: hypothetical protein VNN73_05320 [Blastocatellia bacterium]|nr:hypothetical protein [Blastocatellia bacterium]